MATGNCSGHMRFDSLTGGTELPVRPENAVDLRICPVSCLWSPHIGLVGHSGVGRTAQTHWLTGEAESPGGR